MDKLTKEELEIIRSVPIHKLLGIQNNGRNIMVRCPFHSERTPSCVISPDNSYHCFGCGKHGNGAIDFCQDLGYSFKDSVIELLGHDI